MPFDSLKKRIAAELRAKGRFVLCIDGRSCSLKSTLARHLEGEFDSTVIHMDDFYLPLCKRGEHWQTQIGGNIDCQRFILEVQTPLARGESLDWGIFDCKSQSIEKRVRAKNSGLIIIEGTYCTLPCFLKYWDECLLLTVDKQEQINRLSLRNPNSLERFLKLWIPMEERYFSACHSNDKFYAYKEGELI